MSGVIKVAVVGDAGTGKTTLISTACKGVFDGRPVPVLPPARLPPDFTSSFVPMVVTDTSSRPEDQAVWLFHLEKVRHFSAFTFSHVPHVAALMPALMAGHLMFHFCTYP
eukprot:1161854-Pelagomonas_calceolata.AAC.8